MDPLRLLSRSTKQSRSQQRDPGSILPSSGRSLQPQLFPAPDDPSTSRKRKRGANGLNTGETDVVLPNFFGETEAGDVEQLEEKNISHAVQSVTQGQEEARLTHLSLPIEDRKRVLKEHKLKVTWLNPTPLPAKEKRKRKTAASVADQTRVALYPPTLRSFNDLAPTFSVSQRLSRNTLDQGFSIPTEVQLAALPLLLDEPCTYLSESSTQNIDDLNKQKEIDLLTIAPTGSGKTLAFLIPLLHHLRASKATGVNTDRHTSAIVLAPTRELTSQIVNEGRKLAQNTGIRVTQMRKGMRFDRESTNGSSAGKEEKDAGATTVVKADVMVSTPGILQSVLSNTTDLQSLKSVRHLVLDEADVLLDPLFCEQTLEVWNHLSNPYLRISMWSATMGSNIEELAISTMETRRRRLNKVTEGAVEEAPVIRLVVGLKDSAVPNVEHKLIYAATEQGKLTGLRQLLHPTSTSATSGPSLRPPFLIFTQTIQRAIALHAELIYDIPAEAGGIDRIAVLHSDLSDTARDNVMSRFRKGEIWVLITTDLLSRGVDFLGVNGVVNYDIPTSSAAYIHRIGRTGRAGRSGGVAVTLYSKEDIPFLKHVVNIVAMAQKQGGLTSGVDQWLLDAIPKLSKNDKQNLKKRGIESRTTRGKQKDPKTARRSQISTKSGYDRRLEARRKSAVVGSQKAARAEAESNEPDDDTDFGGFD